MNWLEVRIEIRESQLEALENQLLELGALAVTLTDSEDHPLLEPGVDQTPLWPKLTVTGLFPGETKKKPITNHLNRLSFIQHASDISFSKLQDQAWERSWMTRFKTMRFGKNLWIVPSTTAKSEYPSDPEAVIIQLDPGLAFGTGTHPTTALCLEWIDAQDFSGKVVIDYGCGSGILAIAAALKGAKMVYAIDNDPQAILATNENARRNNVCSQVIAGMPELETPPADILLANILALPLIEMAAQLVGRLKPHSPIVLSGILEEQQAQVVAAYRGLCSSIDCQSNEEWIRLAAITQ
ncbi:MAG: 50S ribosomal protein L11 methyltransferase [Xanthomonadales bacterium]|nr:50S ribosomal protein L11 methyltransferase [Xanthomonadales bacterium]